MKIRNWILAVCAMMILAGCKTPQNMTYLADSQDGDVAVLTQAKALTLKPADKLSIVVNTKSVELNNVLNLPTTAQIIGYSEAQSLSQSRSTSGYTIDSDGNIDFPLIGKVKAAGLSREQLATSLKEALKAHNVTNESAVVTVEYLNLGFSVMGDVQQPGFYQFGSDRTSLLQALSMAGDLNITGQRERVKIYRTDNGEQKTYVVNLLDTRSLVSSPAYYLQQNDVVYVEPNDYRKRQSTANASEVTRASFWLSAISAVATLAVLIFK